MALYDIAGLKVELDFEYSFSKKLAENYLSDEQSLAPDISIKVTESDYDRLRMLPGFEENKDACEYALAGSNFHRKILDFNAIMLHSSAVVVDDKAYLFSAKSGTGKSTHTSLWLSLLGERAYIINDDKPIIRCFDEGIYVYGSPFSGKNFINANKRARVGAICFIERSKENWIKQIKTAEILPLFLEQTPLKLDAETTKNMLSVIDNVLREVKVYKMGCNMDVSAAKLAFETMSGAVM